MVTPDFAHRAVALLLTLLWGCLTRALSMATGQVLINLSRHPCMHTTTNDDDIQILESERLFTLEDELQQLIGPVSHLTIHGDTDGSARWEAVTREGRVQGIVSLRSRFLDGALYLFPQITVH